MSRLETVRIRGRRQAGPEPAGAAERLAPMMASLRERAEHMREASGPALHTAKDKLVVDVLPRMQETMIHAKVAAEPVAEEALRRSGAAMAALRGEVPARPKRRRQLLRWGLLVTGAAGAGGAAWLAWHRWSTRPDRVQAEPGPSGVRSVPPEPTPDVSLPRQTAEPEEQVTQPTLSGQR